MPEGFDVFLSHNGRDKPIVEEIGARLRSQGLRVWLDKWELRPGFPWQEGIEEGVRASKAVAVFVGKAGLGAWQEPEMRAFIARSRREKVPVIPVLLPGCPDSPELSLFLAAFTWVDLRDGLTDDGLARLVWGITGTKPPGGPVPLIQKPKTWWRWGLGLLLLVVLALGAWRFWPRPPGPEPALSSPETVSTTDRAETESLPEPDVPIPPQDIALRVETRAPDVRPPRPPLYAIRVQVFDPQGRPVEGVTIRTSAGNEPQQLPDGWWEVEIPSVKVPADGRISLRADHEDWEGSQVELSLGNDPNPRAEIHLKEPKTWIRGQVVDQNGHGVPSARVSRQGSLSGVATANEEGYFELELPVPPGTRVRLRAEQGELASGETFCLADRDSCAIELEKR